MGTTPTRGGGSSKRPSRRGTRSSSCRTRWTVRPAGPQSSRVRGSEMAIWLTDRSKILVQGITGAEGTKHTRRMVASGAQVVGGVNPRKAGSDVDGIPVYATVSEAMKETAADVSVVFVPPAFAKDAVVE